MNNRIGITAGVVWGTLNENGTMSYEDLKYDTRLTDFELFTAIGWLARENKLKIEDNSYSLI